MTWIDEAYPAPVPRRRGTPPEDEARPQRLLLTVGEAAEQLTISKTEMWRVIRRGFIPVVRIGRLTRVRPEALVAFVDTLEVAS